MWRVVVLQRNFCLNLVENNWLSHQRIRFTWSILMGFEFFTSVRNCSVKTELIGGNNYAKQSFNCWIICSEVYWQFSMSFAFENTPGQRSRCAENEMSAFCEFQQHFVRNMIPSSLWTILFLRLPLLFRTCKYTVSVAIVLYLEIYSLHTPSVTVNCCWLLPNYHCIFASNERWESFHE